MEPEVHPGDQMDRDGPTADQESEGRRHLQEVRVQDSVLEPDYAERSGETIEGHGSHGNHAESLRPLDGADSASGRQPAQTSIPDTAQREEPPADRDRSVSVERRSEDVGQVQQVAELYDEPVDIADGKNEQSGTVAVGDRLYGRRRSEHGYDSGDTACWRAGIGRCRSHQPSTLGAACENGE